MPKQKTQKSLPRTAIDVKSIVLQATDLRDGAHVVRALPELPFPITNGAHLVQVLGPSIVIGTRHIDVARAARALPAKFFPIADAKAFRSKIDALLKQRGSPLE